MKLVCMLAPSSTPNQIKLMPSASAAGASSGTTMKAISKKSRKKASTKTKRLTKIRKPTDAARQRDEEALDPFLAADALKHQAEDAGANQDEDHHGGDAHGRVHALPGQRPGELAVEPGQQEGADDAHGARLGGVASPMKMVPSTMKISASDGTMPRMQRLASAQPLQCAGFGRQGRNIFRADDAEDQAPRP